MEQLTCRWRATSCQFFSGDLLYGYLGGCVSILTSAGRCVFNDLSSVMFPDFLVFTTLIGFAYREIALGYLATGRDLGQMESNTQSPIFSYFHELLEGIITIRAFSSERRSLDSLHRNTMTKVWLSSSNGLIVLSDKPNL
jgi:hypothetical protein